MAKGKAVYCQITGGAKVDAGFRPHWIQGLESSNQDQTSYIIYRAQCKMEMWEPLLKK